MKKFLISLGLLFTTIFSYAQFPQGGQGNQGKMPSITGRIYGKIIDGTTKQPIEFASVVALRPLGKRDSIIGGGLTLENGEFNIENIPMGGIKIKISFVGYKDFIRPNIMVMPPDNLEIDLGDIKLESDAKVLNSVEVTAQKSTMQLNLDKRVFNVDKNITTAGGTAEDVLKNVPSVTVDGDGTPKVRNNNTTVYVDGRPTMMSINQIPADQIESVEVITNPSAKFEASTTGGIINIVTKKNKKPGYNGFLALGVGTGDRYNGTLNLNVKEGRTNISGFYNINRSKNPTEGYSYRTNYGNNGSILNYYNQNTNTNFNNLFQIARLSLDYQITNRNLLTLAGTFVNGQFNVRSAVRDELLSSSKTILQRGTRDVVPENEFKNYSLQAIWKKTFPKKGKELTSDITYNFGNSVNAANWLTVVNNINPDGSTALSTTVKNIITGGSDGNQVTFQLDYTNPINDSTKIEMGVRSYANLRSQDYLFSTSINDQLKLDTSLSSKFDLDDIINAAYITYGSRLKGISYQAGLRFEASNFDGDSKLNNTPFGYKYPKSGSDIFKSLFPSLYLSKKLDKNTEIQVNFSRKINRPNFMQLMPVIQNNDRQNIRQGNPNLKPEFINLAEVNYNKMFGSNNWLISLYLRNENDPILGIARQINDSITLTTFENGKSSSRYGLDNTLKLSLAKNIELTTNLNVYNINIETETISRNGWTLDGKAGLNWKLPNKLKDFSVQVNGNYETKRIIAQGERLGNPFMDLAVKYTFMRVANVTLAVNDVFNSRKEFTYLTQPGFYQESMRRRDLRFFRVSFQMPFGKMDASIFRKAKDSRRNNNNQNQEMDFGS